MAAAWPTTRDATSLPVERGDGVSLVPDWFWSREWARWIAFACLAAVCFGCAATLAIEGAAKVVFWPLRSIGGGRWWGYLR